MGVCCFAEAVRRSTLEEHFPSKKVQLQARPTKCCIAGMAIKQRYGRLMQRVGLLMSQHLHQQWLHDWSQNE